MAIPSTSVTVLGFMNALATLGYVYVATYVYKVKKEECVCAENWRQDYMFAFSIASVFLGMWISYLCAIGSLKTLTRPVQIAIAVMTCTYVYVSYSYISFLNSQNCTCSEELHVILLYIIQFFNGLLVTYGITFILFLAVAAFTIKKIL